MNCNTRIPIAQIVEDVVAALDGKYVEARNPQLESATLTDTTFRGDLLFEAEAEQDLKDLVFKFVDDVYIKRLDPRITSPIIDNPTIRGSIVLDASAKASFEDLVQATDYVAPNGKMWMPRPLTADSMIVSYEENQEPKARWSSIQRVLEAAGVFGANSSSLESIINGEVVRSKAKDKEISDSVVSVRSDLTAEASRSAGVDAELIQRTDNLATKDAAIQTQIDTLGGGKFAFVTKASMEAASGSLPVNSSVDVFNDPIEANNGTYSFNGTVFTKATYDLENILLRKTLSTFPTKLLMQGTSLPDGYVALVASDSIQENNGFYVRTGGVWVYAKVNLNELIAAVDRARIRADSKLIPIDMDLEDLTPSVQFAVVDGTEQIAYVKDGNWYGNFYAKDGKSLEETGIMAIYDLYGLSDKVGEEEPLAFYDGSVKIAELPTLTDVADEVEESTAAALFYMEGGAVRYANSKQSYTVPTTAQPVSFSPYSAKANLAVTDNTWFKPGKSMVVLGADGSQYPDPKRVLVVVPSFGQSLAVGSQGVPGISRVNPHPEYALMFSGVNTRLDSSGTGGRTPATDFTKVTGFESLRVVNNTANAADDLSKEMIHIPFGQKIVDVLAKNNAAPLRLLSFTAAVGGTLIDMADAPELDQTGIGLKKGSIAYANLIGAIAKAKEVAAIEDWEVVVPTIMFQHGEGDSSNPNYAARITQLISDLNVDIKAITKQTQDIYFYAMLKANHNGSGTVGLEQSLLAAATNPLYKIVGSTYPAEPAVWTDDYTHRSARGYNYMGYIYAKAFHYELKNGFGSFSGLTFNSATLVGKVISVKLNVPVGPIKYKTTDVVRPDKDWGFSVKQNGVALPILAVSISSVDTVSITLENTPTTGSIVITAAMKGQVGTLSMEGIPRTNVSDSDTSFGNSAGGDSTENWLLPFTTTLVV